MTDTQETWSVTEYQHFLATGEAPQRTPEGQTGPNAGNEPPKPSKADIKAEKDLQAVTEGWLTQRGYWRLTAENAKRAREPDCSVIKGWFGHLYNAKKNPLLPDIFLFDIRGRYLLLELKVVNRFQPGQKEMIDMDIWSVAWSFEDVERIVKGWEEWEDSE